MTTRKGTLRVKEARTVLLAVDEMTAAPVVIGPGETLAAAHALMRRHSIRHLPVVDGGELLGLISLGDLHFFETLRDVDKSAALVDEAMCPDPVVVAPETPLSQVALQMAARRAEAAVVVEEGRVIGVFTAVDALHALAGLSR